MATLEVVIGLEVHAQMSTATKMFCACAADSSDAEPNTTVCPICMGHPGTLPVPNARAIEKAVRASLAIGCTVQRACHFDRKHYFYPDLPSGFQISQYDFPLAKDGSVTFDLQDDSGRKTGERVCRILRLHMENDAGKLTHRGPRTLCDFNRAGAPLMEIVTQPDLQNASEAVAFAQELRRILIAVDASEADMFKGMMRFDASISLKETGTEKLNPRSEIKNLNSFKALEKALQYEEKRLLKLWEETGGPLKGNITVGWMDDAERTRVLREKEGAQDYRYFPEPDIPPLAFEPAMIERVRAALPPLPRARREAYVRIGLTEAEALQLMSEPKLQAIFDAVHTATKDAKRASGIVLTQLAGFLKTHDKTPNQAPALEAVLELVAAIDAGKISGNAGKEVLGEMIRSGKSARIVIDEKGLTQISDVPAIEAIVDKAIAANPDAVASFRSGKPAALGAIVGWAMKESKGSANPKTLNEILRKKLGA